MKDKNTSSESKDKINKCARCGSVDRVKIIEYGQKHCTNCGNCWQ